MVEKQFHGPTLAGLTKEWIFAFFPWGGPQVGNQPHVAACGSILLRPAAAASVVVLLFLPSPSPPSSATTSSKFSRCLQPEFHWWNPPEVVFFLQPLLQTYSSLPCLDCNVWRHSWRTVNPLWYERLLQWQQNESKAMMWQLYKMPAIWGYPRRFY